MSDDSDLQQEALYANAAANAAPPRQALPVSPPTTVARPAPEPAPWRPADDAQPFTVASTAPAPTGKSSSLWGTAGAAAWEGAMNMGSDALSAASFTVRQLKDGNPETIAWLEQKRHALDAHIQDYVGSQPADRQMALHASIFGGGDDANGNHVPTPGEVGWKQYAAATLGSLVPDVALAIAPESLVGKLAVKAGMRGAGVTAARMGTTGAAFGTDQAGAAYKDLVDGIDHASDAEMMNNPTYAHLRQDQEMDEVTAKRTLVGKAAPLIAAQFGVGAATGAGVGSLMTHGAMGAAGRGLAGRAGIGAAEGAATMGIQGAAGDYLRQQAMIQAGPQQEYDPTVTAHALVSGALGGALMGAAGGAIHGGAREQVPSKTETAEAGPSTTTADPDANAALQSTLMLTYDAKTPVQPGQVPLDPVNVKYTTMRPPQSDQAAAPAGPDTPTGPTANNTTVVGKTTAEPRADIAAQIAALADPNDPKDAVFIAKGTPMPGNLPPGAKVMVRKIGTLITTNPDKAKLYMARGEVDEARMAQILDYTQNKTDAVASGDPQVVQAKDAQGNVVHEELVSKDKAPDAAEAARGGWRATSPDEIHPPGRQFRMNQSTGKSEVFDPAYVRHVEVTTPEAVQARRAEQAPTHPVDVAAHEAAEPTPAQAEAGNYQKGHLKLHGLDISIETPAGSNRNGPIDPTTGKPSWETTMPGHYGYVKGTTGADGDHVDVTLGSRTKAMFDGRPEDAAKEPVFVIDQIDPATGKFDEHKAMVGYHTQVEAERAYDASFSDGSGAKRRGATNEMRFGDFKDWLAKGDTKAPIGYKEPSKAEQIRAQASAKRAAQKAKMNPTKVEEKPAAFVAEGESPEVAAHDPEQARADAVSKIPEIAKVVQVKKGADVRPIMNRIISDLSDRIGKTNGAPDQIAAELDKWMQDAPKGPIPGTTTGYRQIGEHLTRLLTGEDVKRPGLRAEAIAETRQAGRDSKAADVEDKLAEGDGRIDADEARATIDEVEADRESLIERPPAATVVEGADTSAGLTQDFGAEKQRSAKTSNLDRTLKDLEYKVTQGHMSAADADKLYGRKPDGEGGRKRDYPAFADWLRKQIADRSDAEAHRDAVMKVAEQLHAPGLTAKDKKQLGIKLNAELSKFDPDYVDRLREALHEIEDPVGHAVRPPSHGREISPAIQYQRAVNDPHTNTAVDNLLKGEPVSVNRYLDAIMSDPVARKELEPLVALARRLRTAMPDIKVYNYDQAAAKFGEHFRTLENAGTYYPAFRGREAMITLHADSPMSRVETLLHESLHAVTSDYLNALPEGHPDRRALEAIGEELRDVLETGGLSDRETAELDYALSDQHELHTMLMTNPTVQRVAAQHVPSSMFRLKMSALGYALDGAKSAWSYFSAFVRRALGMPTTVAPRDAMLLDRILRPLQDITDNAIKANRAVDPLQAAAHAMPDFSRIKDAVADHIDPAGLGDTARKLLLPGATTDGIVKWNRDLFKSDGGNSLEAYRAATEAVAARTTAHHDQFADTVRSLLNDIKGPERDKLASLMVEATTADAQIGRKLSADANAHLKELGSQKALQARFNALSEKGKDTYEAVRDYFKKTYRIERDAQMRSMVKTALPDATDAQVQKVAEAARTKAGIERLIAGADTDPIAAAFGDAWNSRRAVVQGIAKVHRMGFVQGDYFPLRRFGDYVVRYGEKGSENYGVEMFERASEAEARRNELVKQGAEGVSQVLDKRSSKLRSGFGTTVVDEMAAAMGRSPELAEHTEAMRDLVNSVLLQHATHSEQARTRMRRQGVKGASTQVERIIAQDFLSTASRLGYLEHGVDRTQALEAMQRHTDYLGREGGPGEQRRAQQVLNELQQRMPSGDDASGAISGLARRFSTLGFVQSLMSPSHMLTSSIEAHMNSTALLGARHGTVRAGIALTRALKDVSPSMLAAGAKNTLAAVGKGLKAADWNLSTVVRDRLIAGGADKAAMTDLFNRLNGAGLIDHSMVREMQRIANPSNDLTRGWWQRFLDLNAAGAHAVDVANKTAIAKAAYDLELRKTGNHDKAASYAIETARQVMPNYNVANKARIATDKGPLGGFAGPLTQFKQYGIHMYSMMANLVRSSIHGASRAERMEARKAFAGILATHAMMAGSLTLIGDPLRWIGGAYDFATGADKPHDYENDVRRWIADAFGPEVGEVVSRGLPHMAGIDIHRRVGLANLLEPPELNSFDKKGFGEAVASAMTGASGQDAAVMAGGLSKMLHGDLAGGLLDLVPRAIRDPMKAANLAGNGVTDSKGKTILAPEKLSTGDIAAQALGFQPARVSEFREGRAAVREAQQSASSERSTLLAGMLHAVGTDRDALIQQVREFNMQNPGQAITYAQILQAQQRARKAAAQPPGSFGLKLPAKAAPALSQAGRFANVQ